MANGIKVFKIRISNKLLSWISFLCRFCATCLLVQNDCADIVGIWNEGAKLRKLENISFLVITVMTNLDIWFWNVLDSWNPIKVITTSIQLEPPVIV